MKKQLLVLLSFAVLINGCAKMPGNIIDPSANGSTNGSGADTYQPLTAGSTWEYVDAAQSAASTVTITGNNTVINGKTYAVVSNTGYSYQGVQLSYYYIGNHVYTMRASTIVYGITVEFTYLNDSLPAGSTWTTKVSDNGLVNGVPAQTVKTIAETNISKTVLGKTYNNVIHTKIDLQYDYGLGSGFTSTEVIDYYLAKNIGVIETDATINFFGVTTTASSYLKSYTIK